GKEPTLQVALDALKLTPFYNAFEISADVPKIYMQEFWVTVSRHHSLLRFKLNGKSYTVNVDNFRDILKICHKLPGKIFKEPLPLLEEGNLSFTRDLGYTGEIKFLSDVNINHMHQPWRSFAAIINKCLSGKTTALESLRLSRAQILWGMYHNKTSLKEPTSAKDQDNTKDKQDVLALYNNGDDFVHPKLSTHDDEAIQDDEVNEKESDDDSNKDSDEEVQGANMEEEKKDEEATHEEDEANECSDFLNKLDDNIKKIIKDQVKEQVKAQVSKILLKIENTVNKQLKAKVLTRSSNESKTSHAVAVNLSELELKKDLIDKIESNKSIQRSDEQKNLYKALVDAYESDNLILDTYRDTASFKRHRGDEDKDKELSAGSNYGSKRRRAGKEPDSTSAPKEKTSKTSSKSYEGLKVDTLTPELLTGPTFELMKGSCKSLVELEYLFEEVYKATTDQLDWNNPEEYLSGGVSSQKYATLVMKTKPTDYRHIKWIKNLVSNRIESARDVYSKRRIIAVTKLEIVDWHNYKHLDWITVRKLTNLTVEECLAFNVSLRMFTRSVVIQRRVEDLQLGVESYQKKLNLTKPDTYRPDLKRREAYIAYSNPRGFIYQNKDKKNRLMRIDELHKFSDRTLNDVRTALNDRLKGIRMEYLP
ncbi:hypothetical protein Tco_0476314, partial [Tanacetum coccineum]